MRVNQDVQKKFEHRSPQMTTDLHRFLQHGSSGFICGNLRKSVVDVVPIENPICLVDTVDDVDQVDKVVVVM